MSVHIKFLIDVNLPDRFSLWHSQEFIHMKDIDDQWNDSKIWEYARIHDLTIITKDADFSNRIIFSEPPPRVIHLRFGNLRFNDFYQVISTQWKAIVELSEACKLVNVFTDNIQGVK